MFVFVLFAVVALASSASIPHDLETHHSGGATSYQHVRISNYHPVPVYIKHEHQQLLHNPVEHGHAAHDVQVHHPQHQVQSHDHGYAIVSGTHQQQQPDHGYGQHYAQQAQDEDGQDLGHYSQAELSGAGLQAYASQGEGDAYSHGQAQEYEQEAAGYEHGGDDAQHYQ